MIMNILNKFKMMFTSTKEIDKKANTVLDNNNTDLPTSIDYGSLGLPNIIENESNKYSMLLMDDFLEQFTLYKLDFKKIKRTHNFDVLKEFKIYEAKEQYAGFITYNLINNLDKLDIAILDLTLEMAIKLRDGTIVEYDGIDIFKMVKDKFPECQISFCTAHTLNPRDPVMKKYMDKFKTIYNRDNDLQFKDYYMSKADFRSDKIYSMIKKVTE